MKYLMYYFKGFIKKFPLSEREFLIGRSSHCDLLVDDELFSRQHVRCRPDGDELLIEDLNSTNGTYAEGVRIHEARVELNRSFSVGMVRFFLKEGDLEEFAPARELIPIFNDLAKDVPREFTSQETRYIRDIYREILKMLLSDGLAKGDWGWFLRQLSFHLGNLSEIGDLALIRRDRDQISMVLSVFKTSDASARVAEFVADFERQMKSDLPAKRLIGGKRIAYCFPILVSGSAGALLYLPLSDQKEESERIIAFITQLSKEIELLSGMEPVPRGRTAPGKSRAEESGMDIVASSVAMKGLINQASKIAVSDIFVLIYGESGTGKELFARLIHEQSARRTGQFVALNCAAIPENLLEAELFGSERGAYTGAFARKHGKLELASGGTLVLDEIGDMPMSVQTKLLRALQEHEFYRLGGNEPIKVDLRIISLTHRDLKQLILEKSFRSDLYYRLVHHIIHLPPLRERPEDIASLINHFTHKFCSKISRFISGFSVHAHQVLMNYDWPGNVRQLENEVKRVVNLADEGEVVGVDLLSEEIRNSLNESRLNDDTGTVACGPQEDLLSIIESCNWSQSQAARKLGMTYQGLHKKIKRLGLDALIREKRTGGGA